MPWLITWLIYADVIYYIFLWISIGIDNEDELFLLINLARF